MKILLLGATGLVGKHVLSEALAHHAVTSVIAPTRRPLAPDPKLVNPVSDRLLVECAGVDAVVCALGTTIEKAGSKEAFREADHVLPLAFARAAREQGTQTFVLVSASVASVRSRLFYPRVKGEVERDIALVGFRSLTLVRPFLIGGERDEPRLREGIAIGLLRFFAPILPRKLWVNPAPTIAAASLDAAVAAEPGVHVRKSASLIGRSQRAIGGT
jgi:uncharacterized protein YbjT (DUF2867 family)